MVTNGTINGLGKRSKSFLNNMENSTIGGVSEGHFPHSFFFGSKWLKNHFWTLNFFSGIGGSPFGAPQPPQGFIDTY